MKSIPHQPVYPIFGSLLFLVILLVLFLSSCGPSAEEQAKMTAKAAITEGPMRTRLAALTAVVATKTAEAMPTPTPPPPFVCIEHGSFMGMSAVLDQFDLQYDPALTYESCRLEEQGDRDVCVERKALEKGEFGPIIPDEETWVIIPGLDENQCDKGDGKWVQAVFPSG